MDERSNRSFPKTPPARPLCYRTKRALGAALELMNTLLSMVLTVNLLSAPQVPVVVHLCTVHLGSIRLSCAFLRIFVRLISVSPSGYDHHRRENQPLLNGVTDDDHCSLVQHSSHKHNLPKEFCILTNSRYRPHKRFSFVLTRRSYYDEH